MLETRRLHPDDLFVIDRQPSQAMAMGLSIEPTIESTQWLAEQPEAWAVLADGRLIACIGIYETFAGAQGVCWAVLAEGIGHHHLALTRFARSRVMASPLARIEALTICADAEAILADYPLLDPVELVAAVMAMPTPQCTWARMMGLTPVHVLRRFGAASQTHMLFERINSAAGEN